MNKKVLFNLPLILFSVLIVSFQSNTGTTKAELWADSQLMEPAELTEIINSEKSAIHIFNIGPSGLIKNAIEIGDARSQENLKNLEAHVKNLSKDASIVIYCGCCPFEHCPNVRPAFQLLNDLNFTNHKLLNLSQNLKVNWIDQGYPMEE